MKQWLMVCNRYPMTLLALEVGFEVTAVITLVLTLLSFGFPAILRHYVNTHAPKLFHTTKVKPAPKQDEGFAPTMPHAQLDR